MDLIKVESNISNIPKFKCICVLHKTTARQTALTLQIIPENQWCEWCALINTEFDVFTDNKILRNCSLSHTWIPSKNCMYMKVETYIYVYAWMILNSTPVFNHELM